MLQEIGWLVLGGTAGGMARFWIAGLIAGVAGARFPLGTLVVNASGTFALGWMVGLGAGAGDGGGGWLASNPGHAFLAVGLLGSYTTVSSFSLQTLALVQAGAVRPALLYAVLTMALCLGAAWLGIGLAPTRWLWLG
jgi:fluoride exporter